jgi:hypothetical protein
MKKLDIPSVIVLVLTAIIVWCGIVGGFCMFILLATGIMRDLVSLVR